MIKGVYTSIITKLAFISLVVLSICNKAYSQEVATKLENPNIIYLRPLGYILGPNIGYEKAINKKISLASELFYEYRVSSNIAFTESVKWYFNDWSAYSPYLKCKAILGVFLDEDPPYEESILMAGLGIGIGYKLAIGKPKQLTILLDAGLRLVAPVGNISNPFERKNNNTYKIEGMNAGTQIYYGLFSPYAPFELSVGVGYAF